MTSPLGIEIAARHLQLHLDGRFHIADGVFQTGDLETGIGQEDFRDSRHLKWNGMKLPVKALPFCTYISDIVLWGQFLLEKFQQDPHRS